MKISKGLTTTPSDLNKACFGNRVDLSMRRTAISPTRFRTKKVKFTQSVYSGISYNKIIIKTLDFT